MQDFPYMVGCCEVLLHTGLEGFRACLTASLKGLNPQNNHHLWVVDKKSAQIGTLKRRER
jgi:hypothetical protein